MSVVANFSRKIDNKTAVIGVVGLGYVGVPLLLAYHDKGYEIVGIDLDKRKNKLLMSGKSDIRHIPDSSIQALVENKRFIATDDFAELKRADCILICVPTPLGKHREPDLSYVESSCRMISAILQPNQIVILESTTYPGTTVEVMVPLLEAGSGLKVNEDFHVAYSPEREDPGNPNFDTSTIPKVVGADHAESLQMAKALYGCMVDEVVEVSSLRTAEAVKLTENIFRSVNIALVNELKVVFEKMDVDVWEVIDAAATKPFGFMPFYPGPGLGGHCIPIDPFYLTWKALEYGERTRFIELAGEINRKMPAHVMDRLCDALSRRSQKSINGAKILVVGLAYKKNVNDMRESPSLVLIEMIEKQGGCAEYYDPFIPEILYDPEHENLVGRKSVKWDLAEFRSYDAVLISTNHDGIDWSELVDVAPVIVDTRNVTAGLSAQQQEKVDKA